MAKRSSGRRARSRKRRPAVPAGDSRAQSGSAASSAAVAGKVGASEATRERSSTGGAPRAGKPRRAHERTRAAGRRSSGGGSAEELTALGERPQPPWHPLPLSELVILVGMIGTIVGFARGEAGKTLLLAGVGAVALGTFEFTIREHLSGYRSHTTLLAAVPTALFHAAAAVALVALGAPSPSWVIAPLVLDVPLFILLFKLLRGRFADARRERRFAGER